VDLTLVSEPVTVTSVLDRTAPTVSVPTVSLPSPAAFPLADARLRVQWSASDALSGVARFVVTDDNGSLVRSVALASPTATSVTVFAAPGSTHTYQVVALDRAGNMSPPVASALVRVREVVDASAAVTYAGTWTAGTVANARGGTLHTTSVAEASASLAFTGDSVGWIAMTGPDYGRAEVYVDGVLVSSVDLHSASGGPHRLVFVRDHLGAGGHTIRVVCQGDAKVDLDSFIVLR
jgi:hypothetical protein